jgi:hypothetical protein
MGRNTVIFGLVLALICPVVSGLGLALSSFMPGCTGGDSGPAAGCILHGVNLNWLIQISILAFMGGFFLVPAGVLVIVIGTLIQFVEAKSRNAQVKKQARRMKGKPYGIYDERGKLLSETEATAVIATFNREACDDFLNRFGNSVSSDHEPLEQLQAHCVAALKRK